MSKQICALTLAAGLTLPCVFTVANAAVGNVTVVADGLHSPRGLDFAPNGELYVAEAGDEAAGYSETGVVSRIDWWSDAQHARVPVLTGLPAYGDVGPADVSFQGMTAYVPIGLGTDANTRDANSGAKKSLLGTVISFNPHIANGCFEEKRWKQLGAYKEVADIAALERASNADGYGTTENPIDSNPFGVLALPGRQIVVDAGANDVYAVNANGRAKLLAVFTAEPNAVDGAQHIPSRVAEGPDGYLYVGEEAFGLTAAHVYKVPPGGCDPTDCKNHYLTDSHGNAITFGHIMDLEFDRAGNLYVLGFPGFFGPPSPSDNALVKVDRSGNTTTIYSGLSNPGGMALSPDGRYAYVSNRTTCWGVAYQPPFPPGAPLSCADSQGNGLYGQVLRISLTKY